MKHFILAYLTLLLCFFWPNKSLAEGKIIFVEPNSPGASQFEKDVSAWAKSAPSGLILHIISRTDVNGAKPGSELVKELVERMVVFSQKEKAQLKTILGGIQNDMKTYLPGVPEGEFRLVRIKGKVKFPVFPVVGKYFLIDDNMNEILQYFQNDKMVRMEMYNVFAAIYLLNIQRDQAFSIFCRMLEAKPLEEIIIPKALRDKIDPQDRVTSKYWSVQLKDGKSYLPLSLYMSKKDKQNRRIDVRLFLLNEAQNGIIPSQGISLDRNSEWQTRFGCSNTDTYFMNVPFAISWMLGGYLYSARSAKNKEDLITMIKENQGGDPKVIKKRVKIIQQAFGSNGF